MSWLLGFLLSALILFKLDNHSISIDKFAMYFLNMPVLVSFVLLLSLGVMGKMSFHV